jgi:flagellar protein FlaG
MSSIGSVAPVPPVSTTTPSGGRTPAGPGAPAAGSPPGQSGSGAGSGSPTLEQLKAAVAAANEQLNQSNRELTFVFDDTLGRMLVKIVDVQTNAVVRQVPSEDMLAAARALSGSSKQGALLRGRA